MSEPRKSRQQDEDAQLEPAGGKTGSSEGEQLEALIAELSRQAELEAVPAHMMEVFSDDQWPQLLFQLQPTVSVLRSDTDLVRRYREHTEAGLGDADRTDPYHWLIRVQGGETLIRDLTPLEFELVSAAMNGASFDQLSLIGWPATEEADRHHAMTEVLLGWLGEGLIVDAGVPLPEGAEFEDDGLPAPE